tara:strand:- start:636 stop:1346 length:711 start_codon:yes stop_codon:yes gene_type:complete
MNHYNNKSTLKLLTLNKKMNQSYESSDMVAWRAVGSLRQENEKLKEDNESLRKFFGVEGLEEENEKLKEENATLRKLRKKTLEEENKKLKEDMKELEGNRMGLIEAWHKYEACGGKGGWGRPEARRPSSPPTTREDCLTDLYANVYLISEWEEDRAFVASRDGLEHPWVVDGVLQTLEVQAKALKDAEDDKIMEMAEMFIDDLELDEEATRAKLEKKYGEINEEVEQYLVERFSEE